VPIVKHCSSGQHTRALFITWAWLVCISCGCFSSPKANWTPGLNIGADKEAAEHFLSALSLQDTTNGDSSDQLWHTLRRALIAMVRALFLEGRTILIFLKKRSDLADLADPEAKSSLDIFRREGFDF
jgi:hypothetical protein